MGPRHRSPGVDIGDGRGSSTGWKQVAFGIVAEAAARPASEPLLVEGADGNRGETTFCSSLCSSLDDYSSGLYEGSQGADQQGHRVAQQPKGCSHDAPAPKPSPREDQAAARTIQAHPFRTNRTEVEL